MRGLEKVDIYWLHWKNISSFFDKILGDNWKHIFSILKMPKIIKGDAEY